MFCLKGCKRCPRLRRALQRRRCRQLLCLKGCRRRQSLLLPLCFAQIGDRRQRCICTRRRRRSLLLPPLQPLTAGLEGRGQRSGALALGRRRRRRCRGKRTGPLKFVGWRSSCCCRFDTRRRCRRRRCRAWWVLPARLLYRRRVLRLRGRCEQLLRNRGERPFALRPSCKASDLRVAAARRRDDAAALQAAAPLPDG